MKRMTRFITDSRGPVRHSMITPTVDAWKTKDDDPNFRVFFFDNLAKDASRLRARILTFLGADPQKSSSVGDASFNRKADFSKIELPEAFRAKLIEIFADEIRLCAERFGGPAVQWKLRYGL